MTVVRREHDAYELCEGDGNARLVLSCEHASERLPPPYAWPDEDLWVVGTHWAYDLGARALTLELAQTLSASAVLSRFSRLLIDPNRDLSQPDLFRRAAEGRYLRLNETLDEKEQARRIDAYYRPYHEALDRTLARAQGPLLLSIHSFTPSYEGIARAMEIGVLFNREEAHARSLHDHLAASFSGVRENEPWSGREGLIHSAESHAERFQKVALELEVRQDLLEDAVYRARLVPAIAQWVRTRFG